MLSLQRTLSLGYLQQRWMRAVLVLLSIALGVATMVATRTLNRHLNLAAQNAANPLSAFAHLMVVNGQAGVPLAAARLIDPRQQETPDPALAGVHSVDPLVVGRVFLPALQNRSVLLLGLEPPSNARMGSAQRPEVKQARADSDPEQPFKDVGLEIEWLTDISPLEIMLSRLLGVGPAVVTPRLAEDLGLIPTAGKTITADKAMLPVRLAGIEKRALVIGIIRSKSEKIILDPNTLFLEASQAGDLIYPRRPGFVTQLNIRLKDGTDALAVRKVLQERLQPPLKVETVDESNEKVRDITAGLELGFAIGGTGALVVGLFLVYNALSVSVAERRHEIGILRSVGATRSQVAGLFVFEASILGLVGSLLGLPLGYALARVAQGPISHIVGEFMPMEPLRLTLDPWTMGLALCSGLLTTVAAALVPAVQAASEEPADVVRRAPSSHRLLYRIIQACVPLLLLLAGLACVFWHEALPLRVGTYAGIVCIFLAGLTATPLLAIVAGKFLQPFFRLFLGLEGRLAADNLARCPGRTGIVIAALAATGALMVQTAGFIKSSEEAILVWLDESIAADLFVTSAAPLTKPGEWMPMDQSIHEKLLEPPPNGGPTVDAAVGVRFHALQYSGRLVMLLALDTNAFDQAQHRYSLARNLTHHPRLREPGTALVSENFAALHKVKVGDHIEVDGPEGPLRLEVIGTIVDYTWNRGTIVVDRAWFRDKFRDQQVDVFDVYLRPEDGKPATEEDRQAVIAELTARLGKEDAIFGVTRSNLRGDLVNQLRRIYGLAYAQQSVVGVVALLGVISALFISVLQRRRELGLLRAVGATRQQVLRSVLSEAVLMGMIGALLGLAIGVVLEWYIIEVMLLDEAGFLFPMRLPWMEAGVVCGLSVLLATVVGLWPAYQATRIRIAEAIAYE